MFALHSRTCVYCAVSKAHNKSTPDRPLKGQVNTDNIETHRLTPLLLLLMPFLVTVVDVVFVAMVATVLHFLQMQFQYSTFLFLFPFRRQLRSVLKMKA